MSAAPMEAELQNEVKEAAYAHTIEQANPNPSENMGNEPATSVAANSTEKRETVNSAEKRETVNSSENDPAQDLSVDVEMKVKGEASKENPSISDKCDTGDEVSKRKMSPLRSSAEEMEGTSLSFQTDDVDTTNVEPVTDHEAMEANFQTNGLENAEITLVVEVNTDAEVVEDSGKKGEESMIGGADAFVETSRDVANRVAVLEHVGSSLSEKGDMGMNPATLHEHTETTMTDSMSQQRTENVRTPDHPIEQDVPVASPMPAEVETQTLALKDGGVTDGGSFKEREHEAKGVERMGEEGPVHDKTQFGEDAERSRIREETGTSLFSAGDSESKSVCILNVTSGSSDEGGAVTHNDERRKGGEVVESSMDVGDEMEAGSGLSRKRSIEESIGGDHAHTVEVSAEVVDGERRKKDGMAVTEAAVSEPQAKSSLCMKGAEKVDFVEGCQGSERSLAEEMVVIRKEEEAGMLENEGVQARSLQHSEGGSGVSEGSGTAEGTLDSTEVLENKEAIREVEPGQWSKLNTGMSADTVMFEKQCMNANVNQYMGSGSGENTNQRRQVIICERDADMAKATLGRGSDPQPQDVGTGSGLGIRQEVTKGEVFPQLIEAGKEVQGEADYIALFSNKETSTDVDLVKVEKGGQRKEEAHHLLGQEIQASPAFQGILHYPMSKDVVAGTKHTEGERRVQLERQQNRQVHAEMRVRLHAPDKKAKSDLRKGQEVIEGGSGMQAFTDWPLAKRKEVKEEELGQSMGQHWRVGIVMQVKAKADTMSVEGIQQGHIDTRMKEVGYEQNQGWAFQGPSYENAACGVSRNERAGVIEEEKIGMSDEANTGTSEEEKMSMIGLEKVGTSEKASLKRKLSENLASDSGIMNEQGQNDTVIKKAKKKAVNVWAKTSSRKGPKKNSKNGVPQNPPNEASVLLTPVYVNPDKLEDGPDQPIALSKYDKAEKIELSENRLSASSTKGYRMVRATRGVQEGTWYFEIVVEQLGPTGHTRLGWSTQKGDVQAPVGFDCNSYGYRDIDGSKTHVAVREPYGDFYVEGDVIGFYIHLPNGAEYAPKPAPVLSYGGRPYISDIKEEHPRKVPGSEICFFRNGVCQGTAFKDINAGRYFPAASMYTLPKEPNCTVRFNFGPEFRFPPLDIGDRPAPNAMFYAPYHNVLNGKEVGSVAWAHVSTTENATLNSEQQMKIV